MTQRQIERDTGINQATLSRGDKGEAFSRESAETLARYFGFPWEERHFLYPDRYEKETAPARPEEAKAS